MSTSNDALETPVDRQSSITTMPGWPATARYGVRPAPAGGLALVQDFLNTRPHPVNGPDLLDSRRRAQAWGAEAMDTWSTLRGVDEPMVNLTDGDVTALRALRDRLDQVLAGEPVDWSNPDPVERAVTLTVRDLIGIESWLLPRGQGWRWIQSAILAEIVLSRETGTWTRMKRCTNQLCGAAFYDSTWNNADNDHGHRTSATPSRPAGIAGRR